MDLSSVTLVYILKIVCLCSITKKKECPRIQDFSGLRIQKEQERGKRSLPTKELRLNI